MKIYLTATALLLSLVCIGAIATPTATEVAVPVRNSDDSSGAPYRLVDSLIQDPQLLHKSWPEMRKAFPHGCSQINHDTALNCPPMTGVVSLSATVSSTGIIDIVFSEPVSCEGLLEVIRRRLGSGRAENINSCRFYWVLDPRVPHAYLRLTRFRKDSKKILLQMAIEQGP